MNDFPSKRVQTTAPSPSPSRATWGVSASAPGLERVCGGDQTELPAARRALRTRDLRSITRVQTARTSPRMSSATRGATAPVAAVSSTAGVLQDLPGGRTDTATASPEGPELVQTMTPSPRRSIATTGPSASGPGVKSWVIDDHTPVVTDLVAVSTTTPFPRSRDQTAVTSPVFSSASFGAIEPVWSGPEMSVGLAQA